MGVCVCRSLCYEWLFVIIIIFIIIIVVVILLLLFLSILCYVTVPLLFGSTILPWNFSSDFHYYKIEGYIHFLLVINWNVKQLDDLLVPAAGAYTFKNSINQCSLHDLQNNAF